MKENELCETCNYRTDCVAVPKGCPFKAEATVEAAMQEIKEKLEQEGLLGAERILSPYGDWHPNELAMLNDLCAVMGCRIGKLMYDKEFILTIDKKVKIARAIFKEYGLDYRATFNTSFHEDWSGLYWDEDVIKIDDGGWEKLRDKVVDLFANKYRIELYRLFGIYDEERFTADVLREFQTTGWRWVTDEAGIEINSDT